MRIIVMADEALDSSAMHLVFETAKTYVEAVNKSGALGNVSLKYMYPVVGLGQQILCDAVVLDYGGMSLGASGFTDWVSRRFAAAIEDYPDTQFFLVSQIYEYDIREEIQKWYKGTALPHNYGVGWDSFCKWLEQKARKQA